MSDERLRAAELATTKDPTQQSRLVAELRRAGRCVVDLHDTCECAACAHKAQATERAKDTVRSHLASLNQESLAELFSDGDNRLRRHVTFEALDPDADHRQADESAPYPTLRSLLFVVNRLEFACGSCRRPQLAAVLDGDTPPRAVTCRMCDMARMARTLAAASLPLAGLPLADLERHILS